MKQTGGYTQGGAQVHNQHVVYFIFHLYILHRKDSNNPRALESLQPKQWMENVKRGFHLLVIEGKLKLRLVIFYNLLIIHNIHQKTENYDKLLTLDTHNITVSDTCVLQLFKCED